MYRMPNYKNSSSCEKINRNSNCAAIFFTFNTRKCQKNASGAKEQVKPQKVATAFACNTTQSNTSKDIQDNALCEWEYVTSNETGKLNAHRTNDSRCKRVGGECREISYSYNEKNCKRKISRYVTQFVGFICVK